MNFDIEQLSLFEGKLFIYLTNNSAPIKFTKEETIKLRKFLNKKKK